ACGGVSRVVCEIGCRAGECGRCGAVRVLEDYKALGVECAAMGLRLFRGIRERYPEWRHIAGGDGDVAPLGITLADAAEQPQSHRGALHAERLVVLEHPDRPAPAALARPTPDLAHNARHPATR